MDDFNSWVLRRDLEVTKSGSFYKHIGPLRILIFLPFHRNTKPLASKTPSASRVGFPCFKTRYFPQVGLSLVQSSFSNSQWRCAQRCNDEIGTQSCSRRVLRSDTNASSADGKWLYALMNTTRPRVMMTTGPQYQSSGKWGLFHKAPVRRILWPSVSAFKE